ncbi:polyprotein [Gyromitra esculenta endornavirus 1]|nr:polyprotein [Gyromitra esculenta endornavirus 1]
MFLEYKANKAACAELIAQREAQAEEEKVEVAAIEIPTVEMPVIGIDIAYLLANEFVEALSLAVEDQTTAQYQSIVDDHDSRIVNNTFARIELMQVKTVRPDKNLMGNAFSDMTRVSFVTDRQAIKDPNYEFLMDIASTYAYNNVLQEQTVFDGEVLERLQTQSWFEHVDPENPKYYVSNDPDFRRVQEAELTYIIAPEIGPDNSGDIGVSLGKYIAQNGTVYWSFNGSTEGYTCSWWHQLAAGRTTLEHAGEVVSVIGRKSFHGLQLLVITLTKYNQLNVTTADEMFFDIPVLSSHGIMGAVGVPILQVKRVRLNREFLNRLMTKNITGKVGHEMMMEYAMSLSWFSYNKRGVSLADNKIDPDAVYSHVYVAAVLIARENLQDLAMEFTMSNGLPKVLVAALQAMVHVMVGQIGTKDLASVETILTTVMNRLKTPNIRTLQGEALQTWLSIDAWMGAGTRKFVVNDQVASCTHHMLCSEPLTEFVCWCCKSRTALVMNGRCKCCNIYSKVCYHDINDDHHVEGSRLCSCCELKSNDEICEDCDLSVRVYINEKGADESGNAGRERTTKYDRKKVVQKSGRSMPQGIREEGESSESANIKKPVNLNEFTVPVTTAEMALSLPKNASAIFRNKIKTHEVADVPEGVESLSMVPFITSEPYVGTLEEFEIYDVRDVFSIDCGVDCLKYYGQMNISEMMIKKLTRKVKGLNSADLQKVLSAVNLNSIIIETSGLHFKRVNSEEWFACVVHNTVAKIETQEGNHWMVCRVRRVEGYEALMYGCPTSTRQQHTRMAQNLLKTEYHYLSLVKQMYISYLLAKEQIVNVETTMLLPDLKDDYLFNDTKHDLRRGLYHFKVSKKSATFISMALNSMRGAPIDPALNAVWNSTNAESLHFTEHRDEAIRDICLGLAMLFTNPTRGTRSLRLDALELPNKNRVVDFTQKGLKCKTGDIIFVMLDGVYKPVVLDLKNGQQAISAKGRAMFTHIDVLVPKASFMSSIMRIYAMEKSEVTSKSLEAVFAMKSTRATSGPGGSGKSTKVGELVKAMSSDERFRVLAIACTSGGVKSLAAKLPAGVEVKSFEKASYEDSTEVALVSGKKTVIPKKYDLIIIDECTTIFPWSIGLVWKVGAKLWMLGDPTQISVIDFAPSGGSRAMLNPLQVFEQYGEVEKLTGSFRYGPSLCQALSQHEAMRDLKSLKPKGDTDVFMKHMPRWNNDTIYEMTMKCDVVLVFYKQHLTMLSGTLGSIRVVLITTVHDFQGLEGKHVAVVQAPDSTGADTHLSFGHCLSAATRAVNSLTWISINCFNADVPLHKRLGRYMGMNSDSFHLCGSGNDQTDEIEDEFEDASEWQRGTLIPSITGVGPENIILKNIPIEDLDRRIRAVNDQVVKLPFRPVEFSHEIFTAVLQHFTKVVKSDFKYNPENDVFELTVRAFMTSTTVTYSERTGRFELGSAIPTKYREALKAMITNSTVDGQVSNYSSSRLAMPSVAKYRTVLLAHVVKVMQVNKMQPIFTDDDGTEYLIFAGEKCCAACSGLTFKNKAGIEIARISKDYLSDEGRMISGPSAEHVLQIMEKKEFPFLPSYLDDKQLAQDIVTERIVTAMVDLGEGITGINNWMWHHKYSNVLLAEKVFRTLGIDITRTNHDPMDTYPFWKCITAKNLAFNKLVTAIYGGFPELNSTWKVMRPKVASGAEIKQVDHEIVDVGANGSELDVFYEIYLALSVLHIKMANQKGARVVSKLFMKRMGALTIEKFEGMAEDISWHKSRKTKTYFNIVERLSKIKATSLRAKSPVIYVPYETMLGIQAVQNHTRGFASNNRNQMGDTLINACDMIALQRVAGNGSPRVHSYNSTVFASYCIGSTQCSNNTLEGDDQSKIQYALDSAIYKQMLEKHLKNLAAGHPDYDMLRCEIENIGPYYEVNPTIDDSVIALTGPQILKLSGVQLQEFRDKHRELYAWMPFSMVQEKNQHFFNVPGSKRFYLIHTDSVESLSMGNYIHGTRAKWQLMTVMGKIGLYKYSSNPVWIETPLISNQLIVVATPRLLLDPAEAVASGDLVRFENVSYNADLLNNLSRRCLKPGTTFDDLKVQLRTLINTSQFSTHSVAAKYHANIAHGKRCMRLAWYMHQADLHKYSLLDSQNDSAFRWKESALLFAGDMLKKLIPDADEEQLVDTVLKMTGVEEQAEVVSKVLREFFMTLQKLKLAVVSERRKLKVGNKVANFELGAHQLFPMPARYLEELEVKKYAMYWLNTCAHCNDGMFQVAAQQLSGGDLLSSDRPVQGPVLIRTSGCKHKADKNMPEIVLRRSGNADKSNELRFGYSIANERLDVRICRRDNGVRVTGLQLKLPMALDHSTNADDVSRALTSGILEECLIEVFEMTEVVMDVLSRTYNSKIVVHEGVEQLVFPIFQNNALYKLRMEASGEMVAVRIRNEVDTLITYSDKAKYVLDNLSRRVRSVQLAAQLNVSLDTNLVEKDAPTLISDYLGASPEGIELAHRREAEQKFPHELSLVLPPVLGFRSVSYVTVRALEFTTFDGYFQLVLVDAVCFDYGEAVILYLIEADGETLEYEKMVVFLNKTEYAPTTEFPLLNVGQVTPEVLGGLLKVWFSAYEALNVKDLVVDTKRGVVSNGMIDTLSAIVPKVADLSFIVRAQIQHPVYYFGQPYESNQVQLVSNELVIDGDGDEWLVDRAKINGIELKDMHDVTDLKCVIMNNQVSEVWFRFVNLESLKKQHPQMVFGHFEILFRVGMNKYFTWNKHSVLQTRSNGDRIYCYTTYGDYIDRFPAHCEFKLRDEDARDVLTMLGKIEWLFSTKESDRFFYEAQHISCFEVATRRMSVKLGKNAHQLNKWLLNTPLDCLSAILVLIDLLPNLERYFQAITVTDTFDMKYDEKDSGLTEQRKIAYISRNVDDTEVDAVVQSMTEAEQHDNIVEKLVGMIEIEYSMTRKQAKKFLNTHAYIPPIENVHNIGIAFKHCVAERSVEGKVVRYPSVQLVIAVDNNYDLIALGGHIQGYEKNGKPSYAQTLIGPSAVSDGLVRPILWLSENDIARVLGHRKYLQRLMDIEAPPVEDLWNLRMYTGTKSFDCSIPAWVLREAECEMINDVWFKITEVSRMLLEPEIEKADVRKRIRVEQDQHYDRLNKILKIEEGARFDLPTELVDAFVANVGSVQSIFINPLFGRETDRLALGRDLLSSNTHLVAARFTDVVTTPVWMLDWLGTLYRRIKELKSDSKTVWNVYSLKEGIASRMPAKTEGRHLNISSYSALFESVGFETLRLDADPGRFGACLRVMFAFLVPAAKRVHIRSGRPGLHVLFVEQVQAALGDKIDKNGVLTTTWTFAPFLDGMTIVDKPSAENSAACMAAMMNYGDIYGIDEANYRWFELKDIYHYPASKNTYSNLSTLSNLKEIHQGFNMINMGTLPEVQGGVISLEIADASMADYGAYLQVIKYLDPLTPDVDTRNVSGFNFGADAKKRAADAYKQIQENAGPTIVKADLIEDKFVGGMLVPVPVMWYKLLGDANKSLPVDAENKNQLMVAHLTNFTSCVEEIIMSPVGARYCVRDCVQYALDFMTTKNCMKYDWRNVLTNSNFKPYQTMEETLAILISLHINFVFIDGMEIYKFECTQGPMVAFMSEISLDGASHMVVVELKESVFGKLAFKVSGDAHISNSDLVVDKNSPIPLHYLAKIEKFIASPPPEMAAKNLMSDYKKALERELTVDGTLSISVEVLERICNARIRVWSRFDIVMRGTKKQLFTHARRTMVSAINNFAIEGAKPEIWHVSSLEPFKVYLFVQGRGFFPRLTHVDHDGRVFVVGGDFCPHVALDIGAKIVADDFVLAAPRGLRSGAKLGVINKESKDAMMRADWNGDVPINPKADVLYLYEFDNLNHHGRPFRDEVVARPINNLRIPKVGDQEYGLEWTHEMLESFKFDGPIRLGLKSGQPAIVTAVESSILDKRVYNYAERVRERTINDVFNIAKAWHNSGWQNVGNRLMPVRNVVALAFSTIMTKNTPTVMTYEQAFSKLGNITRISGKLLILFLEEMKKMKEVTVEAAQTAIGNVKENLDYEMQTTDYTDLRMRDGLFKNEIHKKSDFTTTKWHNMGYGPTPNVESIRVANEKKSQLDEFNDIDEIKQEGVAKHQYWAKQEERREIREAGDKTREFALTRDQDNAILALMSLNDITMKDDSGSMIREVNSARQNVLLVGQGVETSPVNGDVYPELVSPSIISYWDDNTAMVDNVLALPRRDVKLQQSPEFNGLRQVYKHTMTEYPTHAQPAYTSRANAGLQAVSELYGSFLNVRTVEHDPKQDAKQMIEIYMKEGSTARLKTVGIDYSAVVAWLKERPDWLNIANEIDELLSSGLDVVGMDKVKVHMKVESRLKDVACRALMTDPTSDTGMPGTIEEQRIRLIVWQQKGITAIFAALFSKIKDNLKRCLKESVVYTDGMTPQQLSALMNKVSGENMVFVEDDLKKQDRQTDATCIATEMEFYKLLGGAEDVIDMWSVVHKKWRAKGIGLKFVGDATRHTGQATTALGNVTINLLVHMRFVKEQGNNLKMMVVLGDDNLMICKAGVTESDILKNSAAHFNQISKPHVDTVGGGYLRMICYMNSNGVMEMGPDFVRLRRKHEVLGDASGLNLLYPCVCIPPFGGKSSLKRNNPDVFVDHDDFVDEDVMDAFRSGKHKHLPWETLNEYLRACVPQEAAFGKILLSWHDDCVPEWSTVVFRCIVAIDVNTIEDDLRRQARIDCELLLKNMVHEDFNSFRAQEAFLLSWFKKNSNGSTKETVELRNMSYAVMIGALPEMKLIAKERGWPIRLEMWYEYATLVKVLANKYQTSETDIENHVNLLMQRIRSPKLFVKEQLMFVEKSH